MIDHLHLLTTNDHQLTDRLQTREYTTEITLLHYLTVSHSVYTDYNIK